MKSQNIQTGVILRDHMGREVPPPKFGAALSALDMRNYYVQAPVVEDTIEAEEKLIRAQIPYMVTLLVYYSKFDMEPTPREYFVYAPMKLQKATTLASKLWIKWESKKSFNGAVVTTDETDMRNTFPKLDVAMIARPMPDEDFDSHWLDVRNRRHFYAGAKNNPFAFTCLDQDVKLFKTTDIQEGLHHTV